MRQQNYQAALSSPLGLAAGDELIEDALRVVSKVSKLCLPAHQRVRITLRVTQLETCSAIV